MFECRSLLPKEPHMTEFAFYPRSSAVAVRAEPVSDLAAIPLAGFEHRGGKVDVVHGVRKVRGLEAEGAA
jgi:hypothetical protein